MLPNTCYPTQAKGGVLARPPAADAPDIEFAFKAPVAMALAPWWAEMLPRYKVTRLRVDAVVIVAVLYLYIAISMSAPISQFKS